MSTEIAKQWLDGAVNNVGQKDLEAHMGIISMRISLQSIPQFNNIDSSIRNASMNSTMT